MRLIDLLLRRAPSPAQCIRRADHLWLRTWCDQLGSHRVFTECACGWCSPQCDTDIEAARWWELHVRQMTKSVPTRRDQLREVLARHGRVALDDLEPMLDELMEVIA